MEYPTFITATPAGSCRRMKLPELVVEHEFGHQYWYGMVATNDSRPWMDEGINSYTVKVLDSILARTPISEYGRCDGGERNCRGAVTRTWRSRSIAQKAYDYYNSASYFGITTAKRQACC